ncbi:acyl-CoA--6-aminopenicillanic acid acyl-transferase [Acetobacterium paludosum]|uniref:Acyl-CoA--6-aminopenicillanic acid acyl-transferase n=1 Tax=Acetobacterium paludosum TaxID=52693 RepID=A0A923HX97_9FIRM|nr:C45 family peptidase [Acetobacterium paludosum]MBC3888852.1 acyl-CoA--6-aminopenicillanic acid acyl-transferase [Acetobacterium paludosum]
MKQMPVIELSGTSYDIGYQHGTILKNQIHDFYNTIFELHMRNITAATDKNTLLDYTGKNIGFLKNYSVELYEELQGIADGSGLAFEEIVFLNSFLELEDIRPPELGGKLLSKRLWGCTSFNILPQASKDNKPYVGQTFDMEQYYSKYNIVLKIHPKQGPDQLVYSMAGILGLNGMNSNGIALSINKIVANDARFGVLYPLIIRKALAQVRVGDAFGAIVFTERAAGINYQLSCKDGVAWCIEASATDYDLIPIQGAIAHTNHYLSARMRKFETANWLSHGGSYVRHQVSSNILAEHLGKIDIELIKTVTRDHTNYPRCICAHGFEEENEMDAFATVAAVIYDTAEGIMYVCHENPCTNEYVQIKL